MTDVLDSIKDEINTLFNEGSPNLNLGCGRIRIEGCINCDLYDPTADRKLDARDLSDYISGGVNAIYATELLEHFTEKESHGAIKEWHRVLKPKGHLIISVPDMGEILKVASDWGNSFPGIWKSLMNVIYGMQLNEGDIHKWGYSAQSLVEFISNNGFEVKRVYRGYPRRPTPTIMIIAEKKEIT